MKNYFIYILSSKKNGSLYIGVTNDLERRVKEHQLEQIDGFTKKYHIHTLVYFESTESIESAIAREKQLKGYSRMKKIRLIERENIHWIDLSSSLGFGQ